MKNEDPSKVGKRIASNYINLFKGRFLSHVIGFIGSIMVIRILLPQDYGILSLAMSLPYLLGSLGNGGVNVAVTRMVAMYRDDEDKVKQLISSGIFFDFMFGTLLAILGYFLTPYIFTYIYDKPSVIPYAQFASLFSIPYWGSSSIFQGILGLEYTNHNGNMWIVHYSIQTVLGIGLALSPLRIYGVVIAYMIAYIGIIVYGIVVLTKKSLLFKPTMSGLKELLNFGLPLTLPSISSVIGGVYSVSLVNRFFSIFEISNFTASNKTGVLIDTVVNPLGYSVQPTLSRMDYNDKESVSMVLSKLYKLDLIVNLPVLLTLEFMSYPIIFLLAGQSYTLAPLMLRLSVIRMLETTLSGYPILNAILLYSGKTRTVSKINTLTQIIFAGLITILVPVYSFWGYFLASWVDFLPSLIISFISLREMVPGYMFPYKDTLKIALVTLTVLSPLLYPSVITLIFSVPLIFLLLKTYVITKVVSKEEINVIMSAIDSSSLKVISPIIRKVLA